MDTYTKLGILADAAKYDAACTSSGVERGPAKGKLGMASNAGCCHSFTPDGRCVILLKVLLSNACSYDCAYCVNRRSNQVPRASFTPRELAELTLDFYKRNYIEGLFLSSGVLGDADATTEKMIECLRILRHELHFNGYVHAKAIPGSSPELIDQLGRLADRISVNIELPSAASLERLCPEKSAQQVVNPMAQIAQTLASEKRLLGAGGSGVSATHEGAPHQAGALARSAKGISLRAPGSKLSFAPAGQATQLIIGATPEDDNHILKLSQSLYQRFNLKRVFFSAYMPLIDDAGLPEPGSAVPLRREHRLYQADWLMRFYNFDPDELVNPHEPWLDLDVDPKLAWALRNINLFPIELMDAPRELLLRVPGIGPTGARRIIRARRSKTLNFDDLKRLRITLKRARYFIRCAGKLDSHSPLDAELIREKVIADARASAYNRTRRVHEAQLSLF